MTTTEQQEILNRCLHDLTSSTAWFQRENIAAKLNCLKLIRDSGTSGMISSLIPLLKHNNETLRTEAAETIVQLFATLTSLHDYRDALKLAPIELSDITAYARDFPREISGQLLNIATLNYDGYIRERAVRELQRLRWTGGLKFMLLRLGDWVSQVRQAAVNAVEEALHPSFANEWITQLPTIQWLNKVERVDLTAIYNRIIEFVFNGERSQQLSETLPDQPENIRFAYYRILLTLRSPTEAEIKTMARDKSFTIRLLSAKQLNRLEENVQRLLITQFLHDHSAALRMEALYAAKKWSPELDEVLMPLLCDESAGVRALTRQLLNKHNLDLASWYRNKIAANEMVLGSARGLVETGWVVDLEMLQKTRALGSKGIMTWLAAVKKFDAGLAVTEALTFLTYPATKVGLMAAHILEKQASEEVMQKVRMIYQQNNTLIKIRLLHMYDRIGGWKIIGDVLLAASDGEEIVREVAWDMLERWKTKSVRLFASPTASALAEAKINLNRLMLNKATVKKQQQQLLESVQFVVGK